MKPILRAMVIIPLFAISVYISQHPTVVRAGHETRFAGHTSSQTLALSADGSILASVNPDNNSISLFDTRPGTNQRFAVVPVGVEPNSVAAARNMDIW